MDKLCPVCEEGFLIVHEEMHYVDGLSELGEIPIRWVECDSCGSELAGPEEAAYNVRQVNLAVTRSERLHALQFLKKIYPSATVEDTESSVKSFLDIIDRDEIRVCDTDFHSDQIIQGPNWNETTKERAAAALEKSGLVFGGME